MSTTSKLRSLVSIITDEITDNIGPKEFRVFLNTYATQLQMFEAFTELTKHESILKDKTNFKNFVEAVVWHTIIRVLPTVLMADDDFDEAERAVCFQFMEPAIASIAAVDRSWEQFFPLTEIELSEVLTFSTDTSEDNNALIRIYRHGEDFQTLDMAIGLTLALATGSTATYSKFIEVCKLACRICALADGNADQDEREAIQRSIDALKLGVQVVQLAIDHNLHEGFAEMVAGTEGGIESENTEHPTIEKVEGSPADLLKQATDELDNLIGLETVKEEVSRLANYLKVEAKRKEAGLPSSAQALHFVFTGNPGTGKTTVGRIMAKLLYGYEVLSTANLTETDRSNLVGGYLGQTAIKTKEVIDAAINGVLFVDEAYTLSKRDDQFGQEAIDTILKSMEDNRDCLVVIAAGYTDNMNVFLESNPGLKSRFTRFIDFPDYTPKDLCKIFVGMAEQNQYKIDQNGLANLGLLCHSLFLNRDENFGNGRLVRNLFEKTLGNHADRIVELDDITKEVLTTITAEDLPYDTARIEKQDFLDGGDERWNAHCSSCDATHKAKLKMLGRNVTCKCGAGFRVPFWSIIDNDNRFSKLLAFSADEDQKAVWE
jgi:AAA+ superfamily predicted ATPase